MIFVCQTENYLKKNCSYLYYGSKVLILVRMTMTGPGPRTVGSRGWPTMSNRFR